MDKNQTTGKIGVTSDNMFPIIKKFLYSDNEIFLREIVSNGVDAVQKLKTLVSKGEYSGEVGDLQVEVKIDGDKLIISDNGIGMTADEIHKYINEIAISGAEEFVKKYEDQHSIIGHFGLGFYSAFMVSDKVEIYTQSYDETAPSIRWSCEGNPEYQMEEAEKRPRGTDIILHISEEDKEFLDENRILALLKKYCSYLPVPIVFGKEKEWKDGKQVDTDKPRVINETDPMWIKQPSSLTDEDYKEFYRTLFPGNDAPLFWIHLNIDYPFNLTGILYFPQIKSNLDMQKSNISLYCNQVYVTDNVEGIVPDFLNLLHGVIDSPDIPLNVSRSYLQSDARVKKISTYITRKVADKLAELFKSDRAAYEEKWPALDLFVKYGMLTDEKFAEKAKGILLLKDTDEKYYTLEEYKTLIEGNQTDKDKKVIHLYAQDPDRQYSYIRAAKDKGYSVLLLNGPLDMHLIGMLEQKSEDSHFVSVDSDTLENLVRKDEEPVGQVDMTEEDQSILRQLFQSRVPEGDEKQMIHVATANQGAEAKPIVVIQNEYMRRMKDMAHMQQGMDMYGSMPDSYMMTLNIDHPLIGAVLKRFRASDQIDTYTQLMGDRNGFVARRAEIDSQLYDDKNKPDEAKKKSLEEDLKETNAHIDELDAKLSKIYADFAAGQPVIEHLIDLALLASGLLRGEALDRFVSDSMSAISDKLDD